MTPPPPKRRMTWNDTNGTEMISPRTSGMAIASCVFGLIALVIGWLPGCGSIPGIVLAIVALALAVVARRRARVQADANRLLPAIDLGLGAVALLVSLVSTGVMVAGIIHERRNAPEIPLPPEAVTREKFEEHPAEVPGQESVWRAVNGAGEAAFGFLIEPVRDPGMRRLGVYAVAPIGLFESESAIRLVPPTAGEAEPAREVPIGATVWESAGMGVLSVSLDSQGPPPFAYAGGLPVNAGDRVTILTPDDTVEGTVSTLGPPGSPILIELDRPLHSPTTQPIMPPTTPPTTVSATQAATQPTTGPTSQPANPLSLNGCPVVLNDTGTVIAVLGGSSSSEMQTVFAGQLLWPLAEVPPGPSVPPPPAPAAEGE